MHPRRASMSTIVDHDENRSVKMIRTHQKAHRMSVGGVPLKSALKPAMRPALAPLSEASFSNTVPPKAKSSSRRVSFGGEFSRMYSVDGPGDVVDIETRRFDTVFEADDERDSTTGDFSRSKSSQDGAGSEIGLRELLAAAADSVTSEQAPLFPAFDELDAVLEENTAAVAAAGSARALSPASRNVRRRSAPSTHTDAAAGAAGYSGDELDSPVRARAPAKRRASTALQGRVVVYTAATASPAVSTASAAAPAPAAADIAVAEAFAAVSTGAMGSDIPMTDSPLPSHAVTASPAPAPASTAAADAATAASDAADADGFSILGGDITISSAAPLFSPVKLGTGSVASSRRSSLASNCFMPDFDESLFAAPSAAPAAAAAAAAAAENPAENADALDDEGMFMPPTDESLASAVNVTVADDEEEGSSDSESVSMELTTAFVAPITVTSIAAPSVDAPPASASAAAASDVHVEEETGVNESEDDMEITEALPSIMSIAPFAAGLGSDETVGRLATVAEEDEDADTSIPAPAAFAAAAAAAAQTEAEAEESAFTPRRSRRISSASVLASPVSASKKAPSSASKGPSSASKGRRMSSARTPRGAALLSPLREDDNASVASTSATGLRRSRRYSGMNSDLTVDLALRGMRRDFEEVDESPWAMAGAESEAASQYTAAASENNDNDDDDDGDDMVMTAPIASAAAPSDGAIAVAEGGGFTRIEVPASAFASTVDSDATATAAPAEHESEDNDESEVDMEMTSALAAPLFTPATTGTSSEASAEAEVQAETEAEAKSVASMHDDEEDDMAMTTVIPASIFTATAPVPVVDSDADAAADTGAGAGSGVASMEDDEDEPTVEVPSAENNDNDVLEVPPSYEVLTPAPTSTETEGEGEAEAEVCDESMSMEFTGVVSVTPLTAAPAVTAPAVPMTPAFTATAAGAATTTPITTPAAAAGGARKFNLTPIPPASLSAAAATGSTIGMGMGVGGLDVVLEEEEEDISDVVVTAPAPIAALVYQPTPAPASEEQEDDDNDEGMSMELTSSLVPSLFVVASNPAPTPASAAAASVIAPIAEETEADAVTEGLTEGVTDMEFTGMTTADEPTVTAGTDSLVTAALLAGVTLPTAAPSSALTSRRSRGSMGRRVSVVAEPIAEENEDDLSMEYPSASSRKTTNDDDDEDEDVTFPSLPTTTVTVTAAAPATETVSMGESTAAMLRGDVPPPPRSPARPSRSPARSARSPARSARSPARAPTTPSTEGSLLQRDGTPVRRSARVRSRSRSVLREDEPTATTEATSKSKGKGARSPGAVSVAATGVEDDSITAMMRRYMGEDGATAAPTEAADNDDDDDDDDDNASSSASRSATAAAAAAAAAGGAFVPIEASPMPTRAPAHIHMRDDQDDDGHEDAGVPLRPFDVLSALVGEDGDEDGSFDADAFLAAYDARTGASSRTAPGPAAMNDNDYTDDLAAAAAGGDVTADATVTRDDVQAAQARALTSLAGLFKAAKLTAGWDQGRRESEVPMSMLLRNGNGDDDDDDEEDGAGKKSRRSSRRQSSVLSVQMEHMRSLLEQSCAAAIHERDYTETTHTLFSRLSAASDSAEDMERTLVASARAATSDSSAASVATTPFAACAVAFATGARAARTEAQQRLSLAQEAAALKAYLGWAELRAQGLRTTAAALQTRIDDFSEDIPVLSDFSAALDRMRTTALANSDPEIGAARARVLDKADQIASARARAARASAARAEAEAARAAAKAEAEAAEDKAAAAAAAAAAAKEAGADGASQLSRARAALVDAKEAMEIAKSVAGWEEPVVATVQRGTVTMVTMKLATHAAEEPLIGFTLEAATNTASGSLISPLKLAVELKPAAHSHLHGPANASARLGFDPATAFTPAAAFAAAAAARAGMSVSSWRREQASRAALALSFAAAARPALEQALSECASAQELPAAAARVRVLLMRCVSAADEVAALKRSRAGHVSVRTGGKVAAAVAAGALTVTGTLPSAPASSAAAASGRSRALDGGFSGLMFGLHAPAPAPVVPVSPAASTATTPTAAGAVGAEGSAAEDGVVVDLSVTCSVSKVQVNVALGLSNTYASGAAGTVTCLDVEALASAGAATSAAAAAGAKKAAAKAEQRARVAVEAATAVKGFAHVTGVFGALWDALE